MSDLQNHVTSLELSKKLKELGVKQESQFYWVGKTEEDLSVHPINTYNWSEHPAYMDFPVKYSAFLSSELGEMLPWDIVIARNTSKDWIVTYQADGRRDASVYSYSSQSLVQSMGEVVAHLVEEENLRKLIS